MDIPAIRATQHAELVYFQHSFGKGIVRSQQRSGIPVQTRSFLSTVRQASDLWECH